MPNTHVTRTGMTTRTLAAVGISAVAYTAVSLAVASIMTVVGGGGTNGAFVLVAYPCGAIAGVAASRIACDRFLAAYWGRPVFSVFALVSLAFLVGIAMNPDPANERIGNVLRFLATAATAWYAFWRKRKRAVTR